METLIVPQEKCLQMSSVFRICVLGRNQSSFWTSLWEENLWEDHQIIRSFTAHNLQLNVRLKTDTMSLPFKPCLFLTNAGFNLSSGWDFFSSDFIPASLRKNNILWYDIINSHVTENSCYCLFVKTSLVWEKVREGLLSETSHYQSF